MSNLELRKFNMRNIRFDRREAKGPVIVLLGKRDTGKSVLVKDILFYKQDIPVFSCISGSEEGNGFYGAILPKLFIHHEYSSAIIERILVRQKQMMRQIQQEEARYGTSHIDPRAAIIMDDCLFDNSWARDKLMRLLFMNGRHWKLMLMITMQYPLGIPPILRTNIDYVFILRDQNFTNRKRIYENYASMFPTLEAFCQVMNQCTENYECLVIDNNVKSNRLQDQVFWYKADLHADFKLGSKEMWDLSASLHTDEDEGDRYDPSKQRKRGAGPAIRVMKGTS